VRSAAPNPLPVGVIDDAAQFAEVQKQFREVKDHTGKSMQEVYDEWLRTKKRG
jgi:hypothetical protein